MEFFSPFFLDLSLKHSDRHLVSTEYFRFWPFWAIQGHTDTPNSLLRVFNWGTPSLLPESLYNPSCCKHLKMVGLHQIVHCLGHFNLRQQLASSSGLWDSVMSRRSRANNKQASGENSHSYNHIIFGLVGIGDYVILGDCQVCAAQ